MKKVSNRKIGKKTAHRKSLVRNQIRSLIQHKKVRTTTPKAKLLKANVDSLLAEVKTNIEAKGYQKRLSEKLGSKKVAEEMITYVKDNGATSSIVKVGFRDGDNAEMSVVTIGQSPYKEVKSPKKTKPAVSKTADKKKTGTKAAKAKKGSETKKADKKSEEKK